jgi:hypothetical protein
MPRLERLRLTLTFRSPISGLAHPGTYRSVSFGSGNQTFIGHLLGRSSRQIPPSSRNSGGKTRSRAGAATRKPCRAPETTIAAPIGSDAWARK